MAMQPLSTRFRSTEFIHINWDWRRINRFEFNVCYAMWCHSGRDKFRMAAILSVCPMSWKFFWNKNPRAKTTVCKAWTELRHFSGFEKCSSNLVFLVISMGKLTAAIAQEIEYNARNEWWWKIGTICWTNWLLELNGSTYCSFAPDWTV